MVVADPPAHESQPILLPLQPPTLELVWLSIDQIELPEKGPRPSANLRASVAAFGVFDAVRVMPTNGDRFVLRDGRRRVLAAREAGLGKVPAVICRDPEGLTAAVIGLSSHSLRNDNAPWELHQIEELIVGGADESSIARVVGMPVQTLRRRMKLLGLLPGLREAFDADRFGLGIAEAVAKLPAPTQERLLALLEERGKLTHEDVRKCRQAERQGATDSLPFDDLVLDDDLAAGMGGGAPVPNEVADVLAQVIRLSRAPRRPTRETQAAIVALAERAERALRSIGRNDLIEEDGARADADEADRDA